MPRLSSKHKYILQLFDLLKEKGLNMSMDEIADNLGLTKKTLYNNFYSRENLIQTVMNHFFTKLEAAIRERISNGENPVESLYLAAEIIKTQVESLGQTLLRDMSLYKPGIQMFDHTHRLSFYSKLIKENLLRGIQGNYYRDDLNIDFVVLFYVSAVERFYKWDGKFLFLERASYFFKELVTYHLRSIVTPMGREVLESYLQSN